MENENRHTEAVGKTKATAYHYRDENGTVLYDVLRMPDKQFRMWRPDPDNPGKYIKNAKGVRRVPYRLPEIVKASPDEPVFIVEGEKDADILASLRFLSTTNPGGPGNWRDEYNKHLKDRDVLIVPDNDEEGLRHAKNVAKRLDGTAKSTKIVELPGLSEGEDVSDWVAKGGTSEQLRALAAAAPLFPRRPNGPYAEENGELICVRRSGEGIKTTRLANFTARIVSDIIISNGEEEYRRYEIEANVRGQMSRFDIPAQQFATMTWVPEKLGAGAFLYPGQTVKDHTRAAIQALSGAMPTRRLYAHTGWVEINGIPYYLHADGAIGATGVDSSAISSADMLLPDSLRLYKLPVPPTGNMLREAVRASLQMLDAAPPRITAPLLAAVYAAVISQKDFSVHLTGPTGACKSELAALAQRHYGHGMDRLHLPASWFSTPNALEVIGFGAKDALLTVDDFIPTGGTNDVARWHANADRLLRASGNQSGRQRATPDGGLQPTKYPRCLVLSTGEDIPTGHSLRARMAIIEVGPKDVDLAKLTEGQNDAAEGKYASALAGFVAWLAADYENFRRAVAARTLDLQSQFQAQHRRTAPMVAALAAGLELFLKFAKECGALTAAESDEIWASAVDALTSLADSQGEHQSTNDPTDLFLKSLRAAIAAGRAHVANSYGNEPPNPSAWGWSDSMKSPTGYSETEIFWRSKGQRIGWLDGDDLYLEPTVSYKVAKDMSGYGPDALSITQDTLRKRLRDKGLLASTDEKRERLVLRRTLEDSRREVLHLKAETLIEIDRMTSTPESPPNPVGMSPNAGNPNGFYSEKLPQTETRK